MKKGMCHGVGTIPVTWSALGRSRSEDLLNMIMASEASSGSSWRQTILRIPAIWVGTRKGLASGKGRVAMAWKHMAASTISPPLAAPRRPPGNISWTFSSSSLSLKWDPVVPLRNESTVTGYKVRKGHTGLPRGEMAPIFPVITGNCNP